MAVEAIYREHALEACISLIANVITACEFQTYEQGKKVKGSNYYALNVKPNQNESAGEFVYKIVSKMFRDNECLVVQYNDNFYVADSFDIEKYALYENEYSNVQINDFTLDYVTFKESKVFHFRLRDNPAVEIIKALHGSYGKLLTAAQNVYKRKNALRVVMELETLNPKDQETQEAIQDLFDNQLKAWFEANNAGAVLPLQKGMRLTSWNDGRANSTVDTRDIKALVNDILEFTASGVHVPIGLLKGDTVSNSEQMDALIALSVKPLVKIIQSEINAKLFKKAQYLKGDYVHIDISKIKYTDINKLAVAADKLFAIGVNTIDDNLEMLDRPPINTEFSKRRFVTKNYQDLNEIKEGGKDTG